jgi:hypothetical protein
MSMQDGWSAAPSLFLLMSNVQRSSAGLDVCSDAAGCKRIDAFYIYLETIYHT